MKQAVHPTTIVSQAKHGLSVMLAKGMKDRRIMKYNEFSLFNVSWSGNDIDNVVGMTLRMS